MFTIADTRTLKVVAKVDEIDVNRIAEGMPVEVSGDVFGSPPWPGGSCACRPRLPRARAPRRGPIQLGLGDGGRRGRRQHGRSSAHGNRRHRRCGMGAMRGAAIGGRRISGVPQPTAASAANGTIRARRNNVAIARLPVTAWSAPR